MQNFNNIDNRFPRRFRVVAIADSLLNDGFEFAIMLNDKDEYCIMKSCINDDGSTNIEVSGAIEYNKISSMLNGEGASVLDEKKKKIEQIQEIKD